MLNFSRATETVLCCLVVASYLSAQEFAPAGVPQDELPAGNTRHAAKLVDEYLHEMWARNNLVATATIDDAAFLRRASLALNGVPPTADETTAFLASDGAHKRETKVSELLSRSRYADYWAFRLRDWITSLREVKGQGTNLTTLYNYCREAMAGNRNWDVIARDLLAVEGNIAIDGRGNFGVYFDGEANEFAEASSRLFLGTNLACAQCHDHPYVDKWKQTSYWGMAAFFARTESWDINVVGADKFEARFPPIGRSESSVSTLPGGDAAIDGGGGENRAVANVAAGEAVLPNPGTQQQVMPTPLGRDPIVIPDGQTSSRRDQFVDWVVAEDNPFFARAAVNRLFLELTGRGFVDTVDGFTPNVTVRHEPLLDKLAAEFTARGYDLKWLMRTIALSRLFQLEHGDDVAASETWHCAIRRRLNSDQWHDSVLRATGEEQRAYQLTRQIEPLLIEERNARVKSRSELIPAAAKKLRDGKRFAYLADRLPGSPSNADPIRVAIDETDRDRLHGLRKQYDDFGRRVQGSRSRARVSMSDTSEALLRMNGGLVASSLRDGSTAQRIVDLETTVDRVDAVFLHLLSRYPTAQERERLQPWLVENIRDSVVDLMWALIQTTEFQTY